MRTFDYPKSLSWFNVIQWAWGGGGGYIPFYIEYANFCVCVFEEQRTSYNFIQKWCHLYLGQSNAVLRDQRLWFSVNKQQVSYVQLGSLMKDGLKTCPEWCLSDGLWTSQQQSWNASRVGGAFLPLLEGGHALWIRSQDGFQEWGRAVVPVSFLLSF